MDKISNKECVQISFDFLDACKFGNMTQIKSLISNKDLNINICDENGLTPFIWACRNGHIEVVKYLIDLDNLQIDIKDRDIQIAFLWACERNRVEIIKILLDKYNLDLNTYNYDNYNAFMVACKYGYLNIIDILLSKDININEQNIDGYTGLMIACDNNCYNVVEKLLHIKDLNIELYNNKGETAFILACMHNCFEIVKLLVGNVNINTRDLNGIYPIMYACINNNIDMIKILISYGANIDGSLLDIIEANSTKFTTKCKNIILNSIYFLELCKDRNADIKELQNLITKENFDINVHNENGCSAIALACMNGCVDTVKILIKAGIIVDRSQLIFSKDENGYKCKEIIDNNINFIKVCAKCDIDKAKLLLDNKEVFIDIVDRNGNTPLMYACKNGNYDMVDMLIRNGACINESVLNFPNNEQGEKCKILVKDVLSLFDLCSNEFAMLVNNSKNFEIKDNHIPIIVVVEDAAYKKAVRKAINCECICDKLSKTLCINNKYLDTRDENGFTPIMLAAKYGRVTTFRNLLNSNKVDISITDKYSHRLIDYAPFSFLIMEELSNKIIICDKKLINTNPKKHLLFDKKSTICFTVKLNENSKTRYRVEIDKNISDVDDIKVYEDIDNGSDKLIIDNSATKCLITDCLLAKIDCAEYARNGKMLYKICSEYKVRKI